MRDAWTLAIVTLAVSAASATPAFASAPLGQPLSAALGTVLPFGQGAILGLAAAGVVAGVWIARRKR